MLHGFSSSLNELFYHTCLFSPEQNLPARTQPAYKIKGSGADNQKGDTIIGLPPLKPSSDSKEEASHVKNASQGDIPYSGPLEVSGSSGFAWAKQRLDNSSSRSRSSSRSLMFEPTCALNSSCNFKSKHYENGGALHSSFTNSRGLDSYEFAKHAMIKNWSQLEQPDSLDASDAYHSQDLSQALYRREEMAAKRFISVSSNLISNKFKYVCLK